ncbi:MAG: CHASE4 domain-containing protein [Woeseiaceae bacterium]|nr:CHASE4 domain-containing protein [Woeseiaceae bacterium]
MSNRVARRSLQEKVSITLFAVMAALALLSYLVLKQVVAPTFDELELKQAEANLSRAVKAISNDLDNLSAIAADWALWDDAYDYVSGDYPYFEESNLARPTLTNLGLNLLAVYDAEAKLLWGQADDGSETIDLDVLGILDPGSKTRELLITHSDPSGHVEGLVRTRIGAMLISSWPVLRSDSTGPIAGSMIMGQLLDDDRQLGLRERTEVLLEWQEVDEGTVEQAAMHLPLSGGNPDSMAHEAGIDEIVSHGFLNDLFGSPLLQLVTRTPRQISALGQNTVHGALIVLASAGLIVAVVAWLMLRSVIVRPLERLEQHITGMRKSGDLSQRIGETRTDEIGSVATEFDKLAEELHDARKLLLEQSFKAGQADNAAEVLHNIRNAMTPLINGIDRLSKDMNAADSLKVTQAVEELRGDKCPPDRAAKLLQYVESAFAHLVSSNKNAADDLAVASRQARQVEAILADQERHAKAAPIVEELHLSDILDEAMLVIPEAAPADIELDLVNGVADHRVRAHRVGLLQVLGNLILNAYESIQRSQAHSGRIELSAAEELFNDQPMVRLTVSDTGCGFDENFRQKMFQRGFSSKQGHLSGLGLHWCANALSAMGGRIQAESGGPGRGAQFHVLLPAALGG